MSLADLLPGQHSDEVRDHWWWRPGWRVGRRFYAFHITFEGQQALQALAAACRSSLAHLPTVTLIPDQWLHLTMQGIGFTDELADPDVRDLAQRAGRIAAAIPAFEVDFAELIVAGEAIVMPATPAGPVQRLRAAARDAIAEVLGERRVVEDPDRFRPHVSIGYITADGAAAPYVAAVKRIHIDPVRVRISRLDLIEMHRDQRMYEWHTVARLPLGD
ncbi:2'-5' RNA ligase family protein [Krasilnikovia sp. MM14-A1259]|uniref:2'-5' RNA ligase family protein n=1 Tax=Krasilnikovia sp. MM14-A1259 TaxID=3373539 RepID=UPI00399CF7FB